MEQHCSAEEADAHGRGVHRPPDVGTIPNVALARTWEHVRADKFL